MPDVVDSPIKPATVSALAQQFVPEMVFTVGESIELQPQTVKPRSPPC
jgi:hypothetical protein